MTHTPIPWHRNAYNICSIIKINNGPDSNGHNYVDGRHQVKIASAEWATDAAHIVKCVNLHDELIEALKDAHPYITSDALRATIGELIVKAEANNA
jgi:hypothetical protein